MEPDCPLCRAGASMQEHLNASWHFCASCGRCYLLDDTGHLVHKTETNHEPRGQFNPPRRRTGLATD